MILQFNPDGTSEAYNLPETTAILDQIGDVEFREEATLTKKVSTLAPNVYSMEIYDKSGHICEHCKQKKNSFTAFTCEESLDSLYFFIACADCITNIRHELECKFRVIRQ